VHPNTILQAVRKVPPGHYVSFSQGVLEMHRYYSPESVKRTGDMSDNLETLDELFTRAVEKRLMSERPLGAFLSGGVDSSLVVQKMTQILDYPVKTFSVSFDEERYDESKHAILVSDTLQTEHHDIRFSSSAAMQIMQAMPTFYDEPFADSSALPTYFLSEFASQEVVVALSGDGGDEAFGGYQRYQLLEKGKVFAPLGKVLGILDPILPAGNLFLPSVVQRLMHRLDGVRTSNDLYQVFMTLASRRTLESVFPRLNLKEVEDIFKNKLQKRSGDSLYRANLYDLENYLPDDLMYKVDIASMAHSLEVRSPFLDHEVVEFGLSLPASQRATRRETKILLKTYARERLPLSVIDRPKKGFGIPRRSWLKNEFQPLVRDVFSSSDSLVLGWANADALRAIYGRFLHDGSYDGLIWSVLQFELWARHWLRK
jgi:asparagine synthase (glutamine-hydrolysing)